MREKEQKGEMQSNDFKETAGCFSAVVQKTASKKWLVWGVPGVFGTLGEVNSHFSPTRQGRDNAIMLRQLLINAAFVVEWNKAPCYGAND